MARIEYQYHVFEFNRSPLSPLEKEEFNSIRKDFEKFLGDFLEEKETEFRKLKNPHRFNWRMFFILLTSGLALGFTGDFLEKHNHENIGITLDLLALVAGFSIILQPIQWVLSFMKSSSFSQYERKAREYFSFHRSLANASDNYENYLQMVKERTISDFVVFCHEEM